MAKCIMGQASKKPKNKTELRGTLKTKIATAARAIPIKHILSNLLMGSILEFIIEDSIRNGLLRNYESVGSF